MQQISISDLRTSLLEREKGFSDMTCQAHEIGMNPDTGRIRIRNGSIKEYGVQAAALSTLSNQIHVPAGYLSRCPSDLRARNINHWIKQLGEKELFIRFDGDEVRAILTPEYLPVGNLELIDRVAEKYGDQIAGVKYEITPARFVVQVLLKEMNREVQPNDLVQGGFSILNSEVGFSSVEIDGLIHRTVCTNGMILRERHRYRKVHRGKDREQFLKGLDEHLSQVIWSIPETFDALEKTIQIRWEQIDTVFDLLNKQYQLTKEEQESVKSAWEHEEGGSMYSVVQSYTRAANDSGKLALESRVKLQRIGGSIVENIRRTGRWLNLN